MKMTLLEKIATRILAKRTARLQAQSRADGVARAAQVKRDNEARNKADLDALREKLRG